MYFAYDAKAVILSVRNVDAMITSISSRDKLTQNTLRNNDFCHLGPALLTRREQIISKKGWSELVLKQGFRLDDKRTLSSVGNTRSTK